MVTTESGNIHRELHGIGLVQGNAEIAFSTQLEESKGACRGGGLGGDGG